jgi:hypothetical protein
MQYVGCILICLYIGHIFVCNLQNLFFEDWIKFAVYYITYIYFEATLNIILIDTLFDKFLWRTLFLTVLLKIYKN